MRVAYLGNFGPPWSTENHFALSLEAEGCEVTRIQEGETLALEVPMRAAGHDIFVWTQTYGLAETGGSREQRHAMVEALRAAEIPSVGFHLDRWWDLPRQDQIDAEPFFDLDLVMTADGGHDKEWEAAGVNHLWSPPAIVHTEARIGNYDDSFASDIAFVGSWRGGYHPEAEHRFELINHLRTNWMHRIKLWPAYPGHAVRGEALSDLYASAKVIVGDSCLVPKPDGSPTTHYCSDRIPETIGRGGFLLHPDVEGVTDGTLYRAGEHLGTWPLGDFDALDREITYYLEHDDKRRTIAANGMLHVLGNHTYRHRARAMIEAVAAVLA